MTEIEKNNKISAEFQRIIVYFETLDENEKAIIFPLVQNAAFMRVTLDDLQEIIAEQGPVEGYQNGANQFGTKQSAALQSYNSLVKNYSAVIKTLFGLLPKIKRPPVEVVLERHEQSDEEREEEQRRTKAEIDAAAAYQKWQREEEAAGRKVTKSFRQWQEER